MRHAILAAGLLLLAACSTSEPAAPPAPVAVAPSAPVTPAPQPVADTCGAKPLQSLIGKPRTEIPVPVKPELHRVLCTTCPMTMDFNPERVDFLFDATTGLIKEIRCG